MQLRACSPLAAAACRCVAIVITLRTPSHGQPRLPLDRQTLRPVAAVRRHRRSRSARSVALFEEAGKVLTASALRELPSARRHGRCRPIAMRPHEPLVVRGADGHGAPTHAMRDLPSQGEFRSGAACRAIRNGISRRASMAWEGKSLGEICGQIKDPARNGEHGPRRASSQQSRRTRWSAGAGIPAPDARRRPARRRSSAR